MEHRGDIADQAAAAEERNLNQALEVQRKKAERKPPDDFDGEHCVDCDCSIPSGRLQLGFYNCVECQEAREKRQKQRR